MSWHHDDDNLPDGFDAADAWPSDALDRAIADAAGDYNAPTGAAPRDAMWAAIVGARIPAAPDAAPAVVPALHVEKTSVRALPNERTVRDRHRTWWGLAAAAAIFLATGVGIGRWWGGGAGIVQAPAAGPQVATREPAAPPASEPPAATPDTNEPARPSGDRRAGSPVNVGATRVVAAASGETRAPRMDPYDIVVARHFSQAEALLVSYGRDSVDVALDSRLAQWARPLLSNTQLLLDSPAADDPRRRRLLEDLELVLAQFARLAPSQGDSTIAGTDSTTRGAVRADRVERQIIDGTLQRAQLLPRIRNLVASGS